MKTIKIIFLTCLILVIGASCEEFLEESSKIDKTEEMVYDTAEDIENLVAICYGYLKGVYGKESMLAMGEIGTDLWNNAADPNTASAFNIYENMGSEMSWPIDAAVEYLFVAINTCNLAIEYVNSAGLFEEDDKERLESEVRFLRALNYWLVVETWGPMQINKEPIRTAGRISIRDPEQDIYEFMFEDLQYCIDHLDPTTEPGSRVTWLAAKAFKARLALTYAGDYYKNRIGVDYKGIDYYAVALEEAQDVIDAGENLGKRLYSSYADVWDIDKSRTSLNDEFIWSVEFWDEIGAANRYNHVPTRPREDEDGNPEDWDGLFTRQPTRGGGNCQHLWITPRFYSQNHGVGGPSLADILIRIAGEHDNYSAQSDSIRVKVDVGHWYVKYMAYAKFGPTKFVIDLFDETIDQRWDVTFHTAWYKHPQIVPKYRITAPEKCSYPLMSYGTETDTCLFYSKHPLTQAQIDRAAGRYKILSVDNTFEADGTPKTGGEFSSTHIFPHFAKFMNTQSTLELPNIGFSDYYSKRDFPVFRMPEMYLIAAEAALLGSSGGGSSAAFPYIKDLADARAIDGDGAALLASYGIKGAGDMDLDFILDERAREFVGENYRWFDLKRTMKLEERVMMYNIMARPHFNQSIHYLRPLPSILIEASINKSDVAGEGMWQNFGY